MKRKTESKNQTAVLGKALGGCRNGKQNKTNTEDLTYLDGKRKERRARNEEKKMKLKKDDSLDVPMFYDVAVQYKNSRDSQTLSSSNSHGQRAHKLSRSLINSTL